MVHVSFSLCQLTRKRSVGAITSPETSQFYAREKKADEMCEKMKLGADNGNQRLLADRMCEDLKRRVQESKPGR